jgi:HlyD family secretion protein
MTRGRILLALLVGALAAAVGWALWPAPRAVEMATVSRGTLVETVTEDGRTRVRDRYQIAAPVDGLLLRPAPRPGDTVRKGDVLATIVPPAPSLLDARSRRTLSERIGVAEAEFAAAEADLVRVEAERQQAEAEALRAIDLAKRGFLSKQELERRQLALVLAERLLAAATLRKEAADHQRREAKAMLEAIGEEGEAPQRIDLRAPADGRVLRLIVEDETPVTAGTVLLEVGDPLDLEVVVDVLSEDAVRIAPGAPAVIRDWGGARELPGIVHRVEPGAFTRVSALGVEEQRVPVVISLETGAADALGDAYRVTASIEIRRHEGALIVPTGALVRDGDGFAVYRVLDGVARKAKVTLAGRSGAVAAVGNGLDEGDPVVVFPPPGLVEGERVTALP